MLDAESFTRLLAGSYQHCWLIAAAVTGDRAEADDIVQEASLVALRKLADFTAGTDFTAWMSQIVRWTALNHAKKTNRRNTVVTDPAALDRDGTMAVDGTNGAAASIDSAGRLAEHQTDFDDDLLSALRHVGEVARACLLLRVVQHLSYDEIAAILQIPAGTAMSHVHRAKQSLRDSLKHRDQHATKVSRDQEPA